MSKRQVNKVVIEIRFALPAGKPAKDGIAWVKAAIEAYQPKIPAATIRLAGKEVIYLS